MSNDGTLFLLALGPASAAGFYWLMHRHYRNTDQSHHFESETAVDLLAVTGVENDVKVDELRGTKASRVPGDNMQDHRQRVRGY